MIFTFILETKNVILLGTERNSIFKPGPKLVHF